MRIAFISFEYEGEDLFLIGGEATYAKEICTSLTKRGHKIWVFCASTKRRLPYEEMEGLTIFPVYCPKPFPYLRFMFALRKLFAFKRNYIYLVLILFIQMDLVLHSLGNRLFQLLILHMIVSAAEANGFSLLKRLSNPTAEISSSDGTLAKEKHKSSSSYNCCKHVH